MRTVLLRTASVTMFGAGLVIACSSSSSSTDDTGDGGSTTVTVVDSGGNPTVDAAVDGDSGPAVQCTKNLDCPSGVCNQAAGICAAPTCSDGVKNATETDIDCGGGGCAKCDVAKGCSAAGDCTSGVCSGGKCAAPTNTDGVKNGNETGVDCGGTGNPKCADGQPCDTRTDCVSDYCKNKVCSPVSAADGVQNGNETDVDCGGDGNPRCADNLMCLVDSDCQSDVCKDVGAGLRCQPPSATDGKKNGDETDVDCGGSSGVGCVFGKACLVGGDCASNGCNYNHTCAHARSCTAHYGGDTCGTGGPGSIGAQNWEDCCTTIPVTTTVQGFTETVYLDKYPATAGRMRAFMESINYDVRTFVQTVRAAGQMPVIPSKNNGTTRDGVNPVLNANWDMWLPTSFDGTNDPAEIADCDQGYWDYANKTCCETAGAQFNANSQAACDAHYTGTTYVASDNTSEGGHCHYYDAVNKVCPVNRTGIYNGTYTAAKRHVGGTIWRANPQTDTGCFPGSPGTHSYRFPDGVHDPPSSLDAAYDQNVYDTKTINCIDYLIAQAFCVWDGGRAESYLEWQTASNYIAGNQNNWPWTVAPNSDPRKAHKGISATFEGCRFPTMTDANQNSCPVSSNLRFDPTVESIQLADYIYSYEYPTNLIGNDYIVFLTAPGRTFGRGPLGHSDMAGTGFEYTSSVSTNPDSATEKSVITSSARWSSNGSWEVHQWPYGAVTGPLLNKYGKLGVRCAKFQPN